MKYRFYTTDVFTSRIFGGNPLAVLPEAQGLNEAQMQAVASEFNLSETAFVLPPEAEGQTFRVRFFTPGHELPFAGHPTIGTALVLAWTGAIPLRGNGADVVFGEGVGPVPVHIEAKGGKAVSAQLTAAKLPEFGPETPDVAELAAMLSLEPGDILDNAADRPTAVSCGTPFVVVPVTGLDALGRARLDPTAWQNTLADFWAPDVYLISQTGQGEVRARMFAPGMNIAEDPATGAAASALAGYLARQTERRDGTESWTIHQGVEMGRPSLLNLEGEFAGGRLTAVRLSGGAVPVASGEIEVPEV